MAGSVNKVILVGNLGKDPEIRSKQNGDEVCSLSVATSETWRDKGSGERKERTEWHRVVVFNEHLVKVAKEYLRKGSKVYVEGQLQTRKFQSKDGAEQYSTEVVLQKYAGALTLLDGRRDDDAAGSRTSGNARDNNQRQPQAAGHHYRRSDLDDDIPFAPEWRV